MGADAAWYAVRCVFRTTRGMPQGEELQPGMTSYEERITLWLAKSFEDSIVLAEADAWQYAEDVECEYMGFAQAYQLSDEPGHGAEVFSLIRESRLSPSRYLDHFFDTGRERQRPASIEEGGTAQ